MKRVLLFINLPQRDAITDYLIANHLRKHDCDVRVANFLPRNREHVLFYKPDILVGPEPRCEYTVGFYKQCMDWGITVVSKRTEPGACWDSWNAAGEDEQKTVIGGWPYDVDLEIVWSDEFRDIMTKHGYLAKDKIFAAGGVPFDTYFQPPSHLHPPGRKNIVFATGWGHADTNPEYNIPEAPPGSPLHKDAYERHRKGRDAWINLIQKCNEALKNDGYDFFLRMKVGEQPQEYQEKLSGMIKLILPCDTKTCLLNTDLLIHAGSTMGLEAHLLDVPGLSYYGMLNQTKGWDYPHVHQDYTDPHKLIAAIKNIEFGKSNANMESFKKLEKQFYGSIDGKACERIADKLISLPEKHPTTPDEWPADKPDTYKCPGIYSKIEQWICETCRRPLMVVHGEVRRDMIKCTWCGISLARRPAPPDYTPPQPN